MADPKKLVQNKSGQVFAVVEQFEKFDFGPRRGGEKPAVHLERQPQGNGVIVPQEVFDQEYTEVANQ